MTTSNETNISGNRHIKPEVVIYITVKIHSADAAVRNQTITRSTLRPLSVRWRPPESHFFPNKRNVDAAKCDQLKQIDALANEYNKTDGRQLVTWDSFTRASCGNSPLAVCIYRLHARTSIGWSLCVTLLGTFEAPCC
jgi:hypothetical protein